MNMEHNPRPLKLIFLLLGCLLAAVACKKSDESTYYTALQVIHTSPGLYAVDVYLNSDRLNRERAVYFGDTISYRSFIPQTATVSVKKYSSSIAHVNSSINFQNGVNYSLFIVGKPDSVSYILTPDNLDAPATGKARLRFIHAGADAPATDLSLNGTTLFGSRGYKTVTEFIAVEPATYQLRLLRSGTGIQLAGLSLNVKADKIYTIWAQGLLNTPVDSLKLALQTLEH